VFSFVSSFPSLHPPFNGPPSGRMPAAFSFLGVFFTLHSFGPGGAQGSPPNEIPVPLDYVGIGGSLRSDCALLAGYTHCVFPPDRDGR